MIDLVQIRSFEPMSDFTGQRIAAALERIATILEKDLFSEDGQQTVEPLPPQEPDWAGV